MPRTPYEATRFTSTTPHASRAPSSTISLPTSQAPPGETPQQKVARLREAARRAKLDQESTWDKVVLRGRVVADKAHRITATGLIFASVIATAFAALSFGDMILANRKKKRVWFAEQQAAYDRALELAKQAEADGTITQDLALFLNKERAIEQAEAQKKAQGTIWSRAKGVMFGGLKMEEGTGPVSNPGGVVTGAAAATATTEGQRTPEQDPAEALHKMGEEQARRVGAEGKPSLLEASPIPKTSTEDSRVVESRARMTGGPLDHMGEKTATSLSDISGGLLSRFRGP